MLSARGKIAAAVAVTSAFWVVAGIGAYRERARLRGWLSGTRERAPAAKEAEIRSAAADVSRLRSLPYIEHGLDPNHDPGGVTPGGTGGAWPGVNFYFPWAWGRGRAFLVDMDGRVLWRWTVDRYAARIGRSPWIEHFELLPDGSVLAALKDDSVVKLDRDSNPLWATPLRVHHDLWVDGTGDIWAISHQLRVVPSIHPSVPIEADAITVLSPSGREKRSIPILDLLERSGYGYLIPRLGGYPLPAGEAALEVFHTNHVETFDGSLASLSPLFAQGNFLVSMRNLNAIAIVDGRTERIVWLWGPGNLTYQHDPRLLENGHVLVFDNGIARSQVVEVDPRTNEVTWRWAPLSGFFSEIQGAVQRLPNGNTLVTESGPGHAIEIDRSGRIVWQFANPDVDDKGNRNGIMRLTRFDPSRLTFLRRP
jgi:hypothetical protein